MKLAPVVFLFAISLCAAPAPAPRPAYLPPQFSETPAQRREAIKPVLGEIDALFREFAAQRHVPGVVWGIVLDGELVHRGATGFANVEKKIPAASDTRFRIASMTKSFTAMAVLKLRDAGKLGLFDPVEKFLPEFREVQPVGRDAAPITVRHLLTMTAGFPEDNPWGDRQLARSVEDLRAFVRTGIAFSNAPGIAYEYSNLAYALLGQIVSVVAGEPYERYITREILTPLGMKDTRWEFTDVPAEKLALGYRWENNAWEPVPLLHDGTYGAMGGLLPTLDDFARYVSFHLSAWPPRDEEDRGPVRRATLREMQQPSVVTNLIVDAKNVVGDTAPLVTGYGYGLRWMRDAHEVINVGHSGGLPGFGSNYRFYPEHGFAVIAFANLTYASPGGPCGRAGALLIDKAKLKPRVLPASAILETRKKQIVELLESWDEKIGDAILAENFFLDRSREEWMKRARTTLAQAGRMKTIGAMRPENQLRGTFAMIGENGRAEVFFTLTPEANPRVQELRLTFTATNP